MDKEQIKDIAVLELEPNKAVEAYVVYLQEKSPSNEAEYQRAVEENSAIIRQNLANTAARQLKKRLNE